MRQQGGSFAAPDDKVAWRSKKLWDDDFLRRTRENLAAKSPEPNKYYPSVDPVKRSVRDVSFGAAPRFAYDLRILKKEAELPGPGEYPRERVHKPGMEPWTGGPSVRRGGAMSLAYVEDPDHIRNLNHIIRASKHKHLTTPGPAMFSPEVMMASFSASTYRP